MALRLLLIIVALVLAIGTTTRVITCRLCCDAHDIAIYFRRGTVFLLWPWSLQAQRKLQFQRQRQQALFVSLYCSQQRIAPESRM